MTAEKKGALYLRVSTEIQDESTQEPDLRAQAERDGVKIVNVFRDKLSGLKDETKRESLNALLQLDKKDIDIVYVWEISRLSRNPSHFRILIDHFDEKGINICFVKPNTIYSLNPDTGKRDMPTRMLLSLFSEVALFEIEQRVERIKRGKKQAVLSKSHSYTSKPPYGYKKENKALVVNQDKVTNITGFRSEAEIVKTIFELYTAGKSLDKIRKQLNELNIPTRTHDFQKKDTINLNGKVTKFKKDIKWGRRSVHNILCNTVYYGEKDIYSSKRELTKGDGKKEREYIATIQVPSIISKELFLRAQKQFKKNIVVANKAYKNEFLLRGLILCGNCGKQYLGTGSHGKNYYHCSDRTHRRSNTFLSCRNAGVTTRIDKVIWAITKTTYEGNKRKEIIAENLSEFLSQQSKLQEIITVKEELIATNKKKLERLVDNLSEASDLFAAQIMKKAKEVEKDSENLNDDIKELTVRKSVLQNHIKAIENDDVNAKIIENIDSNFALKKEAVNEVLKDIVVHKIDTKFRVFEVNFKNGYKVNVIYDWNKQKCALAPENLFSYHVSTKTFSRNTYKIDGFNMEVAREEEIEPKELFDDLALEGYILWA